MHESGTGHDHSKLRGAEHGKQYKDSKQYRRAFLKAEGRTLNAEGTLDSAFGVHRSALAKVGQVGPALWDFSELRSWR
jgi:hypothetical protein